MSDMLLSASVTFQASKRVDTDDPVQALRDFIADLQVRYGNGAAIEDPVAKDFLSRRTLAARRKTGMGAGRIFAAIRASGR